METSRTLPPELAAEAATRLGWLGLIYAAGYAAAHFGARTVLWLIGAVDLVVRVQDLLGLGAVAMGLAVYGVSRRGNVPTTRLLDLGLVFQVAGAFGIAITEFWDGFPREFTSSITFIPAECVWIVAFPLVVPNTPRKILVSSLLAASMGPAAVVIAASVTGRTVDRPLMVAAYFVTSNYLSVGVAYVFARIVYRFGTRLKHAREIGSYELVDRLGEGGMGEVWRARHRLLARPAAIKLIRSDLLGSSPRSREETARRFKREAKETASLGSIHTIDVYDFGMAEDGAFYYVMELLNGLSLERFVRDFGPMEPARVVHVLRQVCHSLSEAHARGLIHRDIKPANIFLCRLGEDDDFVKVLDFGLVKHFDAPRPDTVVSMQGQTAGTPAYIAPETALGHADIDGRADLYSLGCVAYFLLTGQPVFERETAMATILAHVKDPPPPASSRSELAIPSVLDRLILECLAKDPASRPATATLLSQRLAATVPADVWTPDAAHAWWELHPGALTQSAGTADQIERPAGPAEPRQRCWPRLDRTPFS